AFEVMWPDYWKVVTGVPGMRSPLAGAHGFYVLVEAQGGDAEGDPGRFQSWLESLADSGVVDDAAVARSLADAASFWSVRDAAAEIGAAIGVHLSFDIGLPVGAMDDYAQACRSRLEAAFPGCVALFYGHIGDG